MVYKYRKWTDIYTILFKLKHKLNLLFQGFHRFYFPLVLFVNRKCWNSIKNFICIIRVVELKTIKDYFISATSYIEPSDENPGLAVSSETPFIIEYCSCVRDRFIEDGKKAAKNFFILAAH